MKVTIPPVPTDKIWERTVEIIKSRETLEKARKEAKYFTRNRGMSFSENVIFVVNKGNTSIQTELNRFFTNHKEEISISEQAFSKARNHYDESPFKKLFAMTVEESYAENSRLSRKYRGYYLFAIDGTDVVLPQGNPELRKKYGDMKGVSAAQGSACYDILSERIVCAEMAPIKTDERKLAKKHLEELVRLGLNTKCIVIFDRGYPSLELLRYLNENGFKYLMRVRRKFNLDIDKIEKDEEIEIKDIVVRAVKVPLNDDYETLITNLDWTPEELFELYGKRWGIETDYNTLKNKIQAEAWSGLTETAVLQDFWASLFLNNLVLIEKFYADTLIQQNRANKNNKYIYKANINEIVGTIKDRFIKICLADKPEDVKKTC